MNRGVVEGWGREHKFSKPYGEDTVICNVIGKFQIVADTLDTSVTPGLVNDGYWEPEITSWLLRNVNAGDRFLDVGANAGYFSVLASHLGANVTAFEPNQRYVRLLEETQRINGLVFDVVPKGLSNAPGSCNLIVPGDRHGDATIVGGWRSGNEVQIELSTLDAEYNAESEGSPYVIKIDVEAAEELVWQGARRLTSSDRKGTVLIEWTPGMYSPEFFEDLRKFGEITVINYDGYESSVTRDWLDAQSVWKMIVVRNY